MFFKRIISKLNVFGRLKRLEERVEELSKKTVDERTMKDEPVKMSQILDEWMNGGEESDG